MDSSTITSAIIYHLASGNAFFSGAALVIISVAAAWGRNRWLQLCSRMTLIVGLVLVIFSVTPLPVAVYGVLTVVTMAWVLLHGSSRVPSAWRRGVTLAMLLTWGIAVAWELPFRFRPQVDQIEQPVIGVIGDSISAGISDQGPSTWPQVLADDRKITVRNQARAGATTATARDQTATLSPDVNLLILEIGGNDLLGATTTAEFERDLDVLLQEVCRPGRTVLMFELPLLPFTHGFGRAQRRLCQKYQVQLIPKRVLLGVLLNDSTTIDSIHLTEAGHQQLALEVWGMIHSAFSKRSG